MKKSVLTVALLALMMGLGGCIISIKGDGCVPGKKMEQLETDSAIAEVDAITTLDSESARLNVLMAIAERPGLSPKARLHLIESIALLESESSREKVLMTLARNFPDVSPPKPCDKETDN